MNTWPRQSPRAEMDAFYGNPTDAKHPDRPSQSWQREFIIAMPLPYPMTYVGASHKVLKAISVNKVCAPSLTRVLKAISDHYGNDPAAIAAAGLNLYGGAYNYRLKKGGSTLSVHSWGAAIDLDPDHNQFGGHSRTMPHAAIDAFKAEGWIWGGDWHAPADPMHFQATQPVR